MVVVVVVVVVVLSDHRIKCPCGLGYEGDEGNGEVRKGADTFEWMYDDGG